MDLLAFLGLLEGLLLGISSLSYGGCLKGVSKDGALCNSLSSDEAFSRSSSVRGDRSGVLAVPGFLYGGRFFEFERLGFMLGELYRRSSNSYSESNSPNGACSLASAILFSLCAMEQDG